MLDVQVNSLSLYHLKQFPHFALIQQFTNSWKEKKLYQFVNRHNI